MRYIVSLNSPLFPTVDLYCGTAAVIYLKIIYLCIHSLPMDLSAKGVLSILTMDIFAYLLLGLIVELLELPSLAETILDLAALMSTLLGLAV
jgi:hypothetical protein